MYTRKATIFSGLLLAMASMSTAAMEVYRWTDEDGVVHFSQVAPGSSAEGVRTLDVMGEDEMDSHPGAENDDDPFGYKAHREEMDALWADIEKRREAARQSQAAEPVTQIVYVREEAAYPYIYPGYGYRPPHRPGRPPHRPRPPQRPMPEEPGGPGNVIARPGTLKRP